MSRLRTILNLSEKGTALNSSCIAVFYNTIHVHELPINFCNLSKCYTCGAFKRNLESLNITRLEVKLIYE